MATVLGCFDMLIWHMQLARSGPVGRQLTGTMESMRESVLDFHVRHFIGTA